MLTIQLRFFQEMTLLSRSVVLMISYNIFNGGLPVKQLTLNINKSPFMVNWHQSVQTCPLIYDVCIKIDEKHLTKVIGTIFLGITIDDTLTFKYHYENVLTKFSMVSCILQ